MLRFVGAHQTIWVTLIQDVSQSVQAILIALLIGIENILFVTN